MELSELAESFFHALEERIGPFDRPINFHVYPFDAGGGINLLTVGAGRREFVTYVTWDLFGHQQQKRLPKTLLKQNHDANEHCHQREQPAEGDKPQ